MRPSLQLVLTFESEPDKTAYTQQQRWDEDKEYRMMKAILKHLLDARKAEIIFMVKGAKPGQPPSQAHLQPAKESLKCL